MKRILFLSISLLLGSLLWAQTAEQDLSKYKFKMANDKLLLEKNQFNLGNVYNDETKTETVEVYNVSDSAMAITFNGSNFVKMTLSVEVPLSKKELKTANGVTTKTQVTTVLAPKSVGKITMEYLPSLNKTQEGKQNWGAQNQRVNVVVNGKQDHRNAFNVRATIVENFASLSEEEKAKAPRIEFEMPSYNFGTVNQGEQVVYEFVYKNIGERDLEVRNVKGS